jgi:hypothetical protein
MDNWERSKMPSYEWPKHGAGGPGILDSIILYVEWISEQFKTVYDNLDDVAVIGSTLAWPFWVMYGYFLGWKNLLVSIRTLYDESITFLDRIADTSGLYSLLASMSQDWIDIRWAPRSWVMDKLTDLATVEWGFSYRLISWVIDLVKRYATHITSLFDDRSLWFRDVMQSYYNFLYRLYQDPNREIKMIVTYIWPYLDSLARDPLEWFRDTISTVFHVEGSFWDQPLYNISGNVFDWVYVYIAEEQERIKRTCERVLRYFWEGVK